MNKGSSAALDKWTSGALYDAWMGRWSRLIAREFIQWLGIPGGQRWLDVCCGSGMLSDAIASASFGPPASITGFDLSPGQVASARLRLGSSPAHFVLADAMALPFSNGSFDVAVCGLALNYIPDAARALREIARVTRPGATIAGYVWDYAGGAQFLRAFWDAAIAVDPEAPAFDQARRFAFCTPEGLKQLFDSSGLKNSEVQAIEIVTRFENFDDYWAPLTGGQGSAPNYLASRAEAIRERIQERVRANLPFGPDGAISMPARAWGIRAKRD
jgi:SAM-dependent methyltransferase